MPPVAARLIDQQTSRATMAGHARRVRARRRGAPTRATPRAPGISTRTQRRMGSASLLGMRLSGWVIEWQIGADIRLWLERRAGVAGRC